MWDVYGGHLGRVAGHRGNREQYAEQTQRQAAEATHMAQSRGSAQAQSVSQSFLLCLGLLDLSGKRGVMSLFCFGAPFVSASGRHCSAVGRRFFCFGMSPFEH